MARSNVRGPNSALTEFLRSRGIRIENRRGRENPTAAATPTTEELDTTATPTATSEQEVLDAAVAEELSQALEVEKPRRRISAAAAKSKKRKKGEEDEAYEPENEPDYGRSGFSRKDRPAAGQIEFCARCNCRFTVTIYNKATQEGLLCSACGSADIDKTPRRSKAKPAAKKRRAKAALDGELDRVPKLQDLTIKCIAKHIEDIEMLGDIGHVNMDKICQIISRNRSLTNDTVPLFLDASLKTLSLYDCSKIKVQRLTQVAQMCPHITELRLHMVGQITDTVLLFYANHLRKLTSIALRGCFLITVDGWAKFFEIMGERLQVLEISDTSRFDGTTAKALVSNCPNLRQLTLTKITHLDDEAAIHLGGLAQLVKLDISHAGAPVLDASIVTMLSTAGHSLETLDLSALRELTDALLLEGILPHCHKLQHLYLNNLDLLTDDGVAQFFDSWSSNGALLTLELERCPLIKDRALGALLAHSGPNLRTLNINSLDEMTHEGIMQVAQVNALPQCEVLDISWIRAVDDIVVHMLLETGKALKKLLLWGNNRVTECENSRTCLIIGRETG